MPVYRSDISLAVAKNKYCLVHPPSVENLEPYEMVQIPNSPAVTAWNVSASMGCLSLCAMVF